MPAGKAKGMGEQGVRKLVPPSWGPFRHRAFAVIWTATVVANIGGWMYNAASGWLMTSLNPDPLARLPSFGECEVAGTVGTEARDWSQT